MNQPETNESEPKIIVDSDWKAQVAKEKEAAAKNATSADFATQSKSESRTDLPPLPDVSSPPDPGPLPAPGLEHIISVLFTQALMYLGQMPGEEGGQPLPVQKPMAKQVIDSLDVLADKVKGNTTDEESKMLDGALHALRMAYVNTPNNSLNQ